MQVPRDPSYLKSRLLSYVTIGYIEPRTHYLGDQEPRELRSTPNTEFETSPHPLSVLKLSCPPTAFQQSDRFGTEDYDS